jgi:hypothetical protein
MTHDDELQHKIEQGDFSSLPPDNIDIKAYQEIFKVLNTTPEYTLPDNFANKVVARLEHQNKRNISFEYFWFGFGLILLLASLIVSLSYTSFKLDLGFMKSLAPLKHLAPFKGVFIFGALFVLLLNFVDHRFIKNKKTV